MRINIPLKLQKYKEHIKKSSLKIVYNQNFSFLKIGSTFKDEVYKELYLCYNPYNTNIVFDINNFKNDNQIYKLYPQVVNVGNQEVFAFMVFSTAKSNLEFNIDSLIYNKKSKIKNLLNSINEKNKIIDSAIIVEDYNHDINSTMMLDDITKEVKSTVVTKYNINKTQYIGDYLYFDKDNEDDAPNKFNAYSLDSMVQIKLKSINFNKKKYVFVITLINNSVVENYLINKIIVSLFDKERKEVVEINKEIQLKKYSQKDVEFSVEDKLLKGFILNDVKVDVDLE